MSQISVDSNKYKDVSVDIYLSQKGWHGVKDRLLVWMTTQQGAFTMLPKCTASVSKANVDALGLRAPSPVVDGDPSSVPEAHVQCRRPLAMNGRAHKERTRRVTRESKVAIQASRNISV